MARYTGPKLRLLRKLSLTSVTTHAKTTAKNPNRPGMHGDKKKRNKPTPYGLQLTELQKLRTAYMLSKKQLVGLFHTAEKAAGSTPENLIALIETRLDIVTFRSNLAPTIFAAQQLVSHGHVQVNGRRMPFRSMRVKEGDIVTLTAKSAGNANITKMGEQAPREIPPYLEGNKTDGYKLASKPTLATVAIPTEVNLEAICSTIGYRN